MGGRDRGRAFESRRPRGRRVVARGPGGEMGLVAEDLGLVVRGMISQSAGGGECRALRGREGGRCGLARARKGRDSTWSSVGRFSGLVWGSRKGRKRAGECEHGRIGPSDGKGDGSGKQTFSTHTKRVLTLRWSMVNKPAGVIERSVVRARRGARWGGSSSCWPGCACTSSGCPCTRRGAALPAACTPPRPATTSPPEIAETGRLELEGMRWACA
jgi:hypothetical protein